MKFKEINNLLELAHLELAEEEKEEINKDLSQILEYVSQLTKVDTEGVEPMNGGTLLENIVREDVLVDRENLSEKLKEAAPFRKENYFKTPPIIYD